MDVTDASDDRLGGAVALFLEGQPLACDDVVIAWDERGLTILSYAPGAPEFATPGQGEAAIARSKQVLDFLLERSDVLRTFVAGRPQEFLYCADHGTAATVLAREGGGTFRWLRGTAPGG